MIGTFQTLESSRSRTVPGSGNRSGFTLLELLVVMVILGILAGLGVGAYRLARRSAKEAQAKADIELLRNALEEYRVEYGAYPADSGQTTFEAMLSSLPADQRSLLESATGRPLELMDPWEHPYHYAFSNRYHYTIWSEGADETTVTDNIDPSQAGY
jgi:general secretion pathway protein G